MALTQADPGASPNDGNGTELRDLVAIINAIITEMWDTDTGGIAYLGGKVGININTPNSKLNVHVTASNDGVYITGPAGINRAVRFETAQLARWAMYATYVAEGGSDDGSNITIASYTDAGAFKAALINIDRATGFVGINKATALSPLAVGGLPVYADNAAALVGGLTAGDFYKTAATGDAQVNVTNAT